MTKLGKYEEFEDASGRMVRYRRGEAGGLVADDAQVAGDAHIGDQAWVDPDARVETGARVGERTWVESGAVVGTRARLGAGVHVGREAVVGAYARVGARVEIGVGARIGARRGGARRGEGARRREGHPRPGTARARGVRAERARGGTGCTPSCRLTVLPSRHARRRGRYAGRGRAACVAVRPATSRRGRLRAPVAQGIEHRSPKAGVARSNRARRTGRTSAWVTRRWR